MLVGIGTGVRRWAAAARPEPIRRSGPAGVVGQDGPPAAWGSVIAAEKNGTPPGRAIENVSAAPRLPRRAVRTKPSAGTLAKETRPCASVTP